MITRERAVAYIAESLETHIAWRDFIRDYPENAREMRAQVDVAGDTTHHERCIAKYEAVLEFLRAHDSACITTPE